MKGRGDRFLLVYFSRLGNRFTVGIPIARCVGTLPVGYDSRHPSFRFPVGTLGWVPMLRWQKNVSKKSLGWDVQWFHLFFSIVLYLSIYLPTCVPTHSLSCQSTYRLCLSTHRCVYSPMYLYLSRKKHFSTHQELPETRENPLCVCSFKQKKVGVFKPPLTAQQRCHFMF